MLSFLQNLNSQSLRTLYGFMGCLGAMFIHLVIGSLYQWGIINVYITSYYHLKDESVILESTAIAFPLMMACVGLTMKVGMTLSRLTHPLIVLTVGQILNAGIIYAASYMPTITLFILMYGVVFGLSAGLNFTHPIFECNKYIPGKRMYVNGFILIGTGAGSLIFGLFSYNFLNPQELQPLNGYYVGTPALEEIANLTPELIKWLAALYFGIGIMGSLLLAPVCIINRNKQNEKKRRKQLLIEEYNRKVAGEKLKADKKSSYIPEQIEPVKNTLPPANQAHSIKEAIKSRIFWVTIFITLVGSCGCVLVNGNYKTYVKNTITDDKFLTIVGVAGAVGNGFSRFFWNLFFSKTGYKTVVLVMFSIEALVLSTMRLTASIKELYLIEVFLLNSCLGGMLVVTPTMALCLYGHQTGTNIYGIYWETFSVANFIGYLFVSQLAKLIEFDGVIYVCLGMVLLGIPVIMGTTFKGPWNNPTIQLEYLCEKEKARQLSKTKGESQDTLNQGLINASP